MNRRDTKMLKMYSKLDEQNNSDDAQRHNSSWLATWFSAAFLLQTRHSTIMPCMEFRNECSICQHNIIGTQRLEAICGHIFHRHCLVMWMRTYAFCPDCPRRM